MKVKIAIWRTHPKDVLGSAINFLTHGPAQHAGFVRGNGHIHELYLPKVRDREILESERGYIRQFDIEGLTDELSAKLERHFNYYLKYDGARYSITDLFRIELNLTKPADGQMVCSQYVFHMLKMICLPPLVRCTEDFISPRDLLISPRFIELAAPVAILADGQQSGGVQ